MECFRFNNDDSFIIVEEFKETIEELQQKISLNPDDIDLFNNFKSDRRKKEWLAVRYLVSIYNPSVSILYTENGQPYLSNNEKISISHSKDVVGIFISKKENPGLDIEEVKERILRIKEKFLSVDELQFVAKSNFKSEYATLMWSCKEALFKIYGKGNIIFDNQLIINDFDIDNDKQISTQIILKNTKLEVVLNFIKHNNIFIVWGSSIC